MSQLSRYSVCLFSYSGVEALTLEALIVELAAASARQVTVSYSSVRDDALISRSRSKVASAFLDTPPEDAGDVLCMIDRDIEWVAGDLTGLAEKALETGGIVGGLYSNRALNKGFASRAAIQGEKAKLGEDRLIPAEYVGTGFIAISRRALMTLKTRLAPEGNKIVLDVPRQPIDSGLKLTADCLYMDGSKFTDFFRPFVVPSTVVGGASEYLSEDWAFARRAAACGVPLHLWCKPMLRHWGSYGYTMATSRRE